MSYLTTSEALNFEFWSILELEVAQIYLNLNSEPLKLPKMTFMDRLNLPKFYVMQNRSGDKIIKFQQSQALTSCF